MKKKGTKKRSGLINKLSLALITISILEITLLIIFIQQIPQQPTKGLDAGLGSLSPGEETIGAFSGPIERVPLNTASRGLYLYDPINSARPTITKNDMQITLNDDSVFDLQGNQYHYNQFITLGERITTFGTSRGDLSDPAIYLDAGTTALNPLYNYTLTFSSNLNVSDSTNVQGQPIKIMDKDYIIGAGSTNKTLYLYVDGHGAEILKIANGQTIKKGADETSIRGTKAIVNAADDGVISGFTISVAMEKPMEDHILPGWTFSDPVFGGLGIEFGGVSPIASYQDRERIIVNTDNERFASVKFTSARALGPQATLTYAHDNTTSTTTVQPILAHDSTESDDKGYIIVKEGDPARLGDWIVINQGDQGTIVEVEDMIVDTSTAGKVYLRDVITGEEITVILTNNSCTYQKTTNIFGGNSYNIEMTQDERYVNITWDDSSDAITLFPRVKLEKGGWISFLTTTLVDEGRAVIYPAGTSTIPTEGDTLHNGINSHEYYGITWLTRMNNGKYEIYGIDTDKDGIADCDFSADKGPAILFIEPRKWDDQSAGDFICIPLTTTGTTTQEIAIDNPVVSGQTAGFFTLGSNTDVKEAYDKYGTFIQKADYAGENGQVLLYYPHTQMQMNISIISEQKGTDASIYQIYLYNNYNFNSKAVVGRETNFTVILTKSGDPVSAQLNLYADGVLIDTNNEVQIEEILYTPAPVGGWTPTNPGYHIIEAEIIVPEDPNSNNNFLTKEIYAYKETNLTINSEDSQNNPVQRYILTDEFIDERTDCPITINGEKAFAFPNLSETQNNIQLGLYELYGYEEGDKEFNIECGRGFVYTLSFEERIDITSEVYNKTTQDDITYYQVFAAETSNNLATEYFYFSAKNDYLKNAGLENLSFGTNGWTLDGKYDFVYCRDFDFTTKQCVSDWQKAQVVDIDNYNNMTSISARGNGIIEAFAITDFVGFDNSSTNLSLEQDIINNLTIIREPYGKIAFKENINISRFRNTNLIEKHVRINNQYIRVDTQNLTELANKTADVIFWNIEMQNPQLKYNGADCPETVCTNTAYDSTAKTFVANVNKFSTFTIEEGAYCGDNVCQSASGETCENCIEDCGCTSGYTCVDGVCESDDDDGGDDGGSSGGSSYVICVPVWNCTWSECTGGSQTYTCTDLSKCATTKGRPTDHGYSRNCEVEKDCTDKDGDGYGEGTDCAGPDIDDNDPGITDTLPSQETETQDTTQENPFESNLFYIIIALFIVAAVIAAFIVILVVINYSNKPKKRTNIKVSESKRQVRADF